GRDRAFEEGSERLVAVVLADAQDDAALIVPRLGSGAVPRGRQAARLSIAGLERILPRAGLEDAERIVHVHAEVRVDHCRRGAGVSGPDTALEVAHEPRAAAA